MAKIQMAQWRAEVTEPAAGAAHRSVRRGAEHRRADRKGELVTPRVHQTCEHVIRMKCSKFCIKAS